MIGFSAVHRSRHPGPAMGCAQAQPMIAALLFAIPRSDRKHVRMMRNLSVFISGKTIHKADELRFVVSAYENRADLSARNQHGERNHVKVVAPPDIFLDGLDLAHLRDSIDVSDKDWRRFDSAGDDNAHGKSPLNPLGSRYHRCPEAYSRSVGLSRLRERL